MSGAKTKAIIADKDEVRVIRKVIIQVAQTTRPNIKLSIKNVAKDVATALPPLNFSQIGKTWPRIAAKPI